MQITKKLYTTLIITVLTVSAIMAAIPMASALSNAPGLYVPASAPTTAKSSGTVGSKVMVVGNATNGTASPFSTVTIYWDNLAGKVLGTTAAAADGTWAINVTIPSAKNGLHYIVAKDDGAAQGAAFNVTSSLKSSTDPSTFGPPYDAKVLPGDALTLTGHGYSPSSAVTVRFHNATSNITLASPSITTNATGSFQAVVIVPAVAAAYYGNWTVNATDASSVFATSNILLDYYITVFPPSGPPGITIMMLGRIPTNQAYTLLIDTTTVSSGTSGTDGTFTATYETPALIGSGAHDIYVRWVIGINSFNRSATFTVGPAPTITLGAAEGVAGAVITISGASFSSLAGITLYFDDTVVNSTTLDSKFGPTGFTGAFTDLEFTVPSLTPKVYTLKVVDQYGASASKSFTIKAAPATTIALRGTSYYQGDTLSFNIVTTESHLGTMTVTIKDPSGATWWTVSVDTSVATGAWSLTGAATKRVLYQDQMINSNYLMLPADAPTVGNWNWTVTYTIISTSTPAKATGLFTVSAADSGAVIAKINELGANMTTFLTRIDGNVVTIKADVDSVQSILSDLNMDTLSADITDIKGDIATITADVSALDATVTSISDDVATVSTTLGTLEGTITSIDGNTATIQTDVGTIKADVSEIGAVDMMPVWIAVVLSLIAAIAAIFAVVTIRQKIAG
jgi:hypothetical protein